MKTVSVQSQKGGAGKSTITVHLATAAVARGLAVRILDTDEQKSAVLWAAMRESKTPEVVYCEPVKLRAAVEKARGEGVELVIIDSPPNAGADAVDIAGPADLILIPCRPGVFDVSAVRRTIDIATMAKKSFLVVLSACPPRAPEIAKTRSAFEAAGVPVAKVEIETRRAMDRALQYGESVIEFEPEGESARQINQLLDEVLA